MTRLLDLWTGGFSFPFTQVEKLHFNLLTDTAIALNVIIVFYFNLFYFLSRHLENWSNFLHFVKALSSNVDNVATSRTDLRF